MKRWWFFFAAGWLSSGILTAQSITLTRLIVVPNQNTEFTLDTINLPANTQQQPVILTYRQNNFFICFEAPGIPPPYAFKLDYQLSQEVQISDSFVLFTDLPSDDYEFSLRAVNRPDLPPARLRLRIESPLWLRWWFLPLLFLYGLLLVGIVFYFLYRYRLRQFMLVHMVRENIARDLHDDMGSYLSSISLLSQSVVNLTQKDPAKANALVQRIGETARQLLDSMGDIIWSVNPDNDSMAQTVARMRDAGADLLDGQNISFTLDLDEALLHSHLALEHRRDFFLIYKESLNNTAKYAQASHVWVRLERNGPDLIFTIQDDGTGFDPAQPIGQGTLGGNGLKNMRIRAKKMGGTLTITTAPTQGTTVMLRFALA